MWSTDEIADIAARAIEAAEARLSLENAVAGLDALDEPALHAELAEGLSSSGLGVVHEQPYPTSPRRRPSRSERERCDLVLLPGQGMMLNDPIRTQAEREGAAQTLFSHAAEDPAGGLVTPADLDPDSAFWIEVKSTGQTVVRDGVPVPNTRYTTELVRSPAADIRKLARERAIAHSAVLMVLFCASEEVARHDLAQAVHRWLDADLPIRSPAIRIAAIGDRIGNAVAAVCLVPVRAEHGA